MKYTFSYGKFWTVNDAGEQVEADLMAVANEMGRMEGGLDRVHAMLSKAISNATANVTTARSDLAEALGALRDLADGEDCYCFELAPQSKPCGVCRAAAILAKHPQPEPEPEGSCYDADEIRDRDGRTL